MVVKSKMKVIEVNSSSINFTRGFVGDRLITGDINDRTNSKKESVWKGKKRMIKVRGQERAWSCYESPP